MNGTVCAEMLMCRYESTHSPRVCVCLDVVKFGEVVLQPPCLSVAPRQSAARTQNTPQVATTDYSNVNGREG